jgi:RAT1-interacting protein
MLTSGRLCKVYLQSHLLGVSEVFVGYRNEDDVIEETVLASVESLIPQGIQAKITRGYNVLSNIRERVVMAQAASEGAGDNSIWRVDIQGGGISTFESLTRAERAKVTKSRGRGIHIPRKGIISVSIANLL